MPVLFIGNYTSPTPSRKQVTEIFGKSGVVVVFADELAHKTTTNGISSDGDTESDESYSDGTPIISTYEEYLEYSPESTYEEYLEYVQCGMSNC